MPKLFTKFKKVKIPKLQALGRVEDVFRADVSDLARVPICEVWGNFRRWFYGMKLGQFNGSTLKYAELTRDAQDSTIHTALGGADKSETNLEEIYLLMEQQRDGCAGVLFTDGRANIFYVKDKNGTLRAVYVDRLDDGWDVDANAVVCNLWSGGRRVFSRGSC